MNLIPCSLSLSHQQLILLAPYGAHIPARFRHAEIHPRRYASILVDVQKLRGRVYLEDGAIGRDQLDGNGRHRSPVDTESWHLLTLDGRGSVSGCVRYHEHPNTVSFQDLGLRHCALAHCLRRGAKLKAAVESELAAARRQAISYVEVGGWALAKERRCTGEALRTALATFGLARILGGCVGIATATVRNSSASILRRIGGGPLELGGEQLPGYYDPQYKCQMEIVRFTSNSPNPKYRRWIDQIAASLVNVPVLSLTSPRALAVA
uniref:Long chain N-acyltyrosine synthase n=1 Tax=uncultured bacterium CSLG7 TaxID=1091577 RepID=G4WV42_9BACT|nr:long chain N-acyltyrosine synthase [uncultured bacterium CSLG7]